MAAGCSQSDECLPCDGDVFVKNPEQASGAAACVRISGDLVIADVAVEALPPLECLERVDGNLTVAANPTLLSAPHMPRLSSVGGVYIAANSALSTVDIPSLRTCEGDYAIVDNPSLGPGAILPAPSLAGDLIIADNPSLQDLSALEGIEPAAGVTIQGNPALNSVGSLEHTTTLTWLHLVNNPALVDLDGLRNLQNVRTDLRVEGNDGLQSLAAFASLQSVSETLSIESNPSLERLDLPVLQIVGYLSIVQNDALVDSDLPQLNDLEGLIFDYNSEATRLPQTAVSGHLEYVSLWGNDQLVDISGLSALDTAGTLDISFHPVLDGLHGVSAMRSVGTLTLWANQGLTNLGGLSGLTEITTEATIRHNQALCPDVIEGFLAGVDVNGEPDVGDNGGACL